MSDLEKRLRIDGDDWAEGHPSRALAHEAAARIVELEAERDMHMAALGEMEAEVEALKSFKFTLESAAMMLAEARANVEARDHIRELEAEVASWKRRYDEAQEQVSVREVTLERLEAERDELKAEVRRHQEAIIKIMFPGGKEVILHDER